MNTCKSILLVEDNLDDVALIQRAFQREVATEMMVVHDGAQALDCLQPAASDTEDAPPLPVLVLLDLNLPKVSGLEVLKQLRSYERNLFLPVVIMTTSSREERDVMNSYKLGANSYIRKTGDSERFIEAVRQLGLYWTVLKRRGQCAVDHQHSSNPR